VSTTLSLAVAAKGPVVDPLPFLDAVAAEQASSGIALETHVAHDGGWPESVESRPGLNVHECPAGTSITRLWGVALANARSDYVAVLDIHCPPAPGWLAAAGACVAEGVPLTWGPVIPASAASGVNMLGYLAEYCQFHPPLDPALEEIPGNNLICRRDLLEEPARLRARGFEKTFTIWRLAAQGVPRERRESMMVTFGKPMLWWSYVHRRALHGRCFGARRLEQKGQPSRWMCLAGSPALPLIRLWRIYRWSHRIAGLRSAFWRYLPRLAISETAWSWGELQGYAVGAGDACDRLS